MQRQKHWSGLPFPSPVRKSEREVAQSCLTSRPHGSQLTRFLRPWDFPGKSAGVGCHRLLRKVKIQLYKSMDAAKTALEGRFIVREAFLKKQDNFKQPNLLPKRIRKRRTSKTQSKQKEGNSKDQIGNREYFLKEKKINKTKS